MKSNLPTLSEDQECYLLVEWMTRMKLRFTHVANESKVPVQYRVKLKRKGVSPGFPDYIIFVKHGVLFLEMKRTKGGVMSDNQLDWHYFIGDRKGCA